MSFVLYFHNGDVHLHNCQCDALKMHLKQLPMRYDSPHYDAELSDLNSIQHNANQCNTMEYIFSIASMERKYDATQFNIF